MFELTPDEYLSLRYQFGTLKSGRHSKYLPFVFTEHGVAMLASILNSERGIEMNIAIVRAFISLRQIALEHKDLAGKLDQLRQELYLRLNEHDIQLSAINTSWDVFPGQSASIYFETSTSKAESWYWCQLNREYSPYLAPNPENYCSS